MKVKLAVCMGKLRVKMAQNRGITAAHICTTYYGKCLHPDHTQGDTASAKPRDIIAKAPLAQGPVAKQYLSKILGATNHIGSVVKRIIQR